mmetsp:Transcript_100964/g.311398  ORF Transcript_100964/g.311398 Transcript_100964/m.311398 type:complete len:210 (-) Transcript_100964:263-892(-)
MRAAAWWIATKGSAFLTVPLKPPNFAAMVACGALLRQVVATMGVVTFCGDAAGAVSVEPSLSSSALPGTWPGQTGCILGAAAREAPEAPLCASWAAWCTAVMKPLACTSGWPRLVSFGERSRAPTLTVPPLLVPTAGAPVGLRAVKSPAAGTARGDPRIMFCRVGEAATCERLRCRLPWEGAAPDNTVAVGAAPAGVARVVTEPPPTAP